jgi:hypothetical protein
MAEEVQHEGGHPGGVIGKARPANLVAPENPVRVLDVRSCVGPGPMVGGMLSAVTLSFG